MGLRDTLGDPAKKDAVISDCCALIDEEVGDKGGISGLAVKAGYKAVKGVKPGFIREVVVRLLPEFADKLDPFWEEGKTKGDAPGHLVSNKNKVADALLTVTDSKVDGAKSSVVKGTYKKLRGSAQKHVEEAIPRLSRLIAKHAG